MAATPVGEGMATLGVLGSMGLFGGGGTVTNPYSGEANADYTSMDTAGTDLTNTGQNTLAQYSQFQPQSNQATENELSYLNTDPYTSTEEQAQLSQATGHAMQGFSAARANMASSLDARGIAQPGQASSEYAGGEGGIDASEAGTLANNQNAIALQAIAARGQRLGLANQVAAQHASSLFDQGAGATNSGASILGTAGNDWLNEGENQIKNTQAADLASSNAYAGLAGIGLKMASSGGT